MQITPFWVAAVSALVFALSFRVNQLFDAYFVYSAGISLLFIPAGVKLLILMVGRVSAYVGVVISGTYLGLGIWPDKTLWPIFLFSFIGTTNYAVATYGTMKWLNIQHDLSNLKYGHVILLSAVTSVTNGIVHNLMYLTQDVTLTEELWVKSLAMTLGDFMGCFVTVGLFHAGFTLVKSFKATTQP